MKKILVTKSFLPPIEDYQFYLKKIWQSNQLTNQGPLLLEFEEKLKKFLKIKNLQFLTNGTLALQLSINALGINGGEIITTPFSYVATTSSILWEKCKPIFVDIKPNTLCIDSSKIESAITKNTKAILAVHVFGIPCEVEKIQKIAKKHHLKVIYDGAHAFGVKYKNKSLLQYGDISICSFHATKLFHTIEGGCVVSKTKLIDNKINLIKRFGHNADRHFVLGINAKASEFQAAMGLCNIKHLKKIIKNRKKSSELYDQFLLKNIQKTVPPKNTEMNYGYYPIILKSEKETLEIIKALNNKNIFPRRYFYPSLTKLPYILNKQKCPISEDISLRILCLPLYYGLKEHDVKAIAEIINKIIK